jgi:RHS repeat-associated protein
MDISKQRSRITPYNFEGRVTAITGDFNASYAINGVNTRVSKTEGGVTNTFRRDGIGVTAPVLADGSANYTPGVSERRGVTTTYLHSGLKNAEAQTSTSQAITAERTYDAFGNVASSTGTWKGPFGYAGGHGYQEDGSGYKLLGHRLYDPQVGRFLTRDPIQDGRNWYAYCDNNPVASYDADGLKERKLTDGEKVIVREAIAKLREAGYTTEATQLEDMLNKDLITYDPDMKDKDGLTPMGGTRRIILGETFFIRYTSLEGGSYQYIGSEDYQWLGKVQNAGLLLHELTHVYQNPGPKDKNERGAYMREEQFYWYMYFLMRGRGVESSIQRLLDLEEHIKDTAEAGGGHWRWVPW